MPPCRLHVLQTSEPAEDKELSMTQVKHRKEKVADDEWPPRATSVLFALVCNSM